MALNHSNRVNILIGNGHFLSRFYVLCLPPPLGMTIVFMSGTTALLQTPVGFLVDRHGARRLLIDGALITPLPFGVPIDKGYPDLLLVLVAITLLLSLLCAGSARVSARTAEAAVMPAE